MEKSLADIHEELEDAMRAAGRLFLMQYEVGTLRSLKEFDEYLKLEESLAPDDFDDDRLTETVIVDAIAEKGGTLE